MGLHAVWPTSTLCVYLARVWGLLKVSMSSEPKVHCHVIMEDLSNTYDISLHLALLKVCHDKCIIKSRLSKLYTRTCFTDPEHQLDSHSTFFASMVDNMSGDSY